MQDIQPHNHYTRIPTCETSLQTKQKFIMSYVQVGTHGRLRSVAKFVFQIFGLASQHLLTVT